MGQWGYWQRSAARTARRGMALQGQPGLRGYGRMAHTPFALLPFWPPLAHHPQEMSYEQQRAVYAQQRAAYEDEQAAYNDDTTSTWQAQGDEPAHWRDDAEPWRPDAAEGAAGGATWPPAMPSGDVEEEEQEPVEAEAAEMEAAAQQLQLSAGNGSGNGKAGKKASRWAAAAKEDADSGVAVAKR